MDVKFSLVFPRDALSVPVMRHMLGDALRSLGGDDQGIADLLLAVTEACTNVVRHGGPGRRYEVVASVGRGGCRVEVLNAGCTFTTRRLGIRLRRPTAPGLARSLRDVRPATFGRSLRRGGERKAGARTGRGREAAPPAAATTDEAIAALPESGRGLAIMRACVDDVRLTSRPESGTVVSLEKRIAWRHGTPFDWQAVNQLADAG